MSSSERERPNYYYWLQLKLSQLFLPDQHCGSLLDTAGKNERSLAKRSSQNAVSFLCVSLRFLVGSPQALTLASAVVFPRPCQSEDWVSFRVETIEDIEPNRIRLGFPIFSSSGLREWGRFGSRFRESPPPPSLWSGWWLWSVMLSFCRRRRVSEKNANFQKLPFMATATFSFFLCAKVSYQFTRESWLILSNSYNNSQTSKVGKRAYLKLKGVESNK